MRIIDISGEEPRLQVSRETDERVRQIEQDGLHIKYQEELRRFMNRKDALEEGLSKA